MDKEINVWRTILKSAWMYFVILFLFINAILYAADVIGLSTNLGEMCFYGLMMLVLSHECARWLKDFTSYSYKLGTTQVEDKQ